MVMNELRKGVHALIVDDSEFSRKIVAKILTEEGFDVVGEAENAQIAVDILNSNHSINLILLDIIMPDVNGIELAKKISKTFKDVYIIMMSSLTQDHIIIEAISAGAQDFIKKPFEKQTLLDSLDKIAVELTKNKG